MRRLPTSGHQPAWSATIREGAAREKPHDLVLRRLREVLARCSVSCTWCRPTVPTKEVRTSFGPRAGMRVMILTNSLEATDVVAVHAGYAKRRKALLRGCAPAELRQRATTCARCERGSSGGGSSGQPALEDVFNGWRTRFVGIH